MKKEHISLLTKSFLFDGIEDTVVEDLLINSELTERVYSKDETIYTPQEFERKIGFVTEGECVIFKAPISDHPVPINTVKKGASFGITSIFSENSRFPTTIVAKSVCSVLFLDSRVLLDLMSKNRMVAVNIIKFLTERIEFLNDRICAFSGISVEKKLVSHILSIYKRTGKTVYDFNKKHTAEAISCGRASLYRAMESLSSGGYVKFDTKKIFILDLEGLERMSQ